MTNKTNLSTIYFPENKLQDDTEGFLVGFKFEGFFFVITAVVPREAIKSIE